MSRRCWRRSKRKCEVEELNRISTSMQPRLLELWEYSVRSGNPNSPATMERNLTFSRSRRTTFLSHSPPTIFSSLTSLTSQPFSSAFRFSFAFSQLFVCNVQVHFYLLPLSCFLQYSALHAWCFHGKIDYFIICVRFAINGIFLSCGSSWVKISELSNLILFLQMNIVSWYKSKNHWKLSNFLDFSRIFSNFLNISRIIWDAFKCSGVLDCFGILKFCTIIWIFLNFLGNDLKYCRGFWDFIKLEKKRMKNSTKSIFGLLTLNEFFYFLYSLSILKRSGLSYNNLKYFRMFWTFVQYFMWLSEMS